MLRHICAGGNGKQTRYVSRMKLGSTRAAYATVCWLVVLAP